MPSFEGKTIKDVDIILQGFGLKSTLKGSGLAYRQQPDAGTAVNIGSQVKVWFAGTSQRADIEEATKALEEEEQKKSNASNKDTDSSKTSSGEEDSDDSAT